MINVTIIWRAIIKLNVIATPSRGRSVTAAATKKAPSKPPTQAMGGAPFARDRFEIDSPEIKTYAKRATVPTTNEMYAARIGLSRFRPTFNTRSYPVLLSNFEKSLSLHREARLRPGPCEPQDPYRKVHRK